MATQTGGTRPFPAVVVVSLLFLASVYPGQGWIADKFPRFAGLATLTPGLTVLDIPLRLPFAIDLILVPGLFIIGYIVLILIASASRRVPLGLELTHRLGAVFAGSFLLLLCLAAGGLLVYAARTFLPYRILKGLESLGVDADLNTGFTPVHLHGNIISLVALVVGLVLFLIRIKKAPLVKRTTQLTREQRMTPYQRMLQQKREQQNVKPVRSQPAKASSSRCRNQPLLSLQPEAVNYRPM
jgi:hypothetical protein